MELSLLPIVLHQHFDNCFCEIALRLRTEFLELSRLQLGKHLLKQRYELPTLE